MDTARFIRTLAAATLVFVLNAAAIGQTSVVLRPAAGLKPGDAVRLADIAELEGDEAKRFSDIVVVNAEQSKARDYDRGFAVTLDDVRAAMSRQPKAVNWGKVTMKGSSCFVRAAEVAPPAVVAKPEPMNPTPIHQAPTVEAAAVSTQTPRGVIAARIAGLQGVGLGDLRLKLSATTRNDEAWLDAPIVLSGEDRIEVEPGAGTASGRVPLRVDVYQAGRAVQGRAFTAEIQIRREVIVTAGAIDRDGRIGTDDVRAETRWLSPAADAPASVEQIIGANAKRKLEAGKVITAADLQPPVVVQKGESVWVHCLSGGFVVKIKAVAMENARDGQLVKLQSEGGKKAFTARMSGRGVAVIELPPSADLDAVYPGVVGEAGAKHAQAPRQSATPAPVDRSNATVRGRSNQPRLPGKN